LEPWLTGEDGYLRFRAAVVLGSVGGDPSQVLSALEPLLTGSDGELRLRAASVLSSVGGDPSQVLSALEPLLTGSDEDLAWEAARIALPLNAPAAIEIYARLLGPEASLVCQRVLDQQGLTEEDGQTLAAFVRVKPDEAEQQEEARSQLFGWLYSLLESQPPALPTA
jgi:HEAT repeat protein